MSYCNDFKFCQQIFLKMLIVFEITSLSLKKCPCMLHYTYNILHFFLNFTMY